MRLLAVISALLWALLWLPGAARADARRIKVDALEYPWSAVGRLNAGGRSYCTAVMISERHLLTAAHCLWNRIQGTWWPVESLHFVAGYQGGEAPLHALIKSYVVADGVVIGTHMSPDQAGADWAVVELAEPLGRQAGWMAVGLPAGTELGTTRGGAGGVVGALGYRAESPHAMSLEYGCRVLAHESDSRVFWHDCPGARGESGGPVIAFLADGPHVLGITSMITAMEGLHLTGAVDAKVMTDTRMFPRAARAAEAAGIGRNPGHPPVLGPVKPLPAGTLAQLSGGGETPSLAALARLLAHSASMD